TTYTRGAADVRFARAGVIVRFDLEADGIVIIENDHAGVVFENAQAKAVVAPRDEILRALEDRFLDQVPIAADGFSRLVHDLDRALERLVNAMLAPGLRDRLQLDVARLTLLPAKIVSNGLHLLEREEQVPVAAEPRELLVVQIADGNVLELETVLVPRLEVVRHVGVEMHRFNHAVGQNFGGDLLQLGARDVALDQIGAAGADLADGQAHVADGHLGRRRHRGHYAGV